MKIINIRESLQGMDINTDCKYNLTRMYESLILDEEKKEKLVKYIDAYDIDATNKLLSNEMSSQGLMEYYDDDLPDEEIVDECEQIEDNKDTLNEDLDQKALRTDVEGTVERFMLDAGFDTIDIKDYSVVEVSPTDSGDMLKIEVRAELGYNDLTKLADKLDIVIQRYDANAYFEPVTSGIIEAFVSVEETEDEVEPIVVEHWVERFKNCDTLEKLKAEYEIYRGEREFMSNATQEEIDIVLDAKIDIMTANGQLDESLLENINEEELDEGIFGKIGSAIKRKVTGARDDYRKIRGEMDRKEKEKHSEYGKQQREKATAHIKDVVGGDVDINRVDKEKEELAELERKVSGPKIASTHDYSRNTKGTNKTGDELDKAIEDARKKGEVYIADIGESLEEDFIDDDISFFKDDYIISDDDDVVTDFKFRATKSVTDSDGFNTDYTWYECADGTHVFVFGDNDIYKPQDGYFDYTCDSEAEAQEWFDSYNGFVDDDLDESKKRNGSLKDKVNRALKESDYDDDEEQYAYVVHFDEDGQNMDEWFYKNEKEKAIKYAKENLNNGPVLYEIDENGIEEPIEYFELDESKSIKESNKIAYGNEKYKGYMIRQDRKYGGYNVYDKQDEMEDSGFKTIDAAKEFIDSLDESKSIKEDVNCDDDCKYVVHFDIDGQNMDEWFDEKSKARKYALTNLDNGPVLYEINENGIEEPIEYFELDESKFIKEETLKESSLLDKVNAALAREENNI